MLNTLINIIIIDLAIDHSISEDYKYTCEQNRDWTPYNSNLHMQGIKVGFPTPFQTVKTGELF